MSQQYSVPSKKQSSQNKRTGMWGAPWWVDLILVPVMSFVFLIVAIIVRAIIGLHNGSQAWYNVASPAWLFYTICWFGFVLIGHNKQGYAKFFPYSGLAVLLAMVVTWLVP